MLGVPIRLQVGINLGVDNKDAGSSMARCDLGALGDQTAKNVHLNLN